MKILLYSSILSYIKSNKIINLVKTLKDNEISKKFKINKKFLSLILKFQMNL